MENFPLGPLEELTVRAARKGVGTLHVRSDSEEMLLLKEALRECSLQTQEALQRMFPPKFNKAKHFLKTVAANIDNEKLSDSDFRDFVRKSLPIAIDNEGSDEYY